MGKYFVSPTAFIIGSFRGWNLGQDPFVLRAQDTRRIEDDDGHFL
jgi:hypothetical protein